VDALGKTLLIAGAVVAAIGGVIFLASRFGIPRMPGDIVVRRGNFTFYAPLGLMLLVSLALTLLLNLVARFRR
jgi:hypothetical protein